MALRADPSPEGRSWATDEALLLWTMGTAALACFTAASLLLVFVPSAFAAGFTVCVLGLAAIVVGSLRGFFLLLFVRARASRIVAIVATLLGLWVLGAVFLGFLFAFALAAEGTPP